MSQPVKLLYFAWVREKVGRAQEEVTLPDDVTTIADLIAWLKSRGEEYQSAFEHPKVIRAAIDQKHSAHDSAIASATEIAFFPPVTGG